MIVCHCNVITRRQIESMIEQLLAHDPYAVLTPGLIYHQLGKCGKCCGCFPQVTQMLIEHGDAIRAKLTGETAHVEESEDEAERVYRRAVAAL